jgi:hypothetical protein
MNDINNSIDLASKSAYNTVKSNWRSIASILVCTLVVMVYLAKPELSIDGIVSFTGNYLILLLCGYAMMWIYFDSGEANGMKTEEYVNAEKDYRVLQMEYEAMDKSKADGFCEWFKEYELNNHITKILRAYHIERSVYDDFLAGKEQNLTFKERRILKRCRRCKPINLDRFTIAASEDGARGGRIDTLSPDARARKEIVRSVLFAAVFMLMSVSFVFKFIARPTPETVVTCLWAVATVWYSGLKGARLGFRKKAVHTVQFFETQGLIFKEYKRFCERSQNEKSEDQRVDEAGA